MSLGYAEKLSYRDDLGGQLGAPELSDSKADVVEKVERLAEMVRRTGWQQQLVHLPVAVRVAWLCL
jgi:hypothetical protein